MGFSRESFLSLSGAGFHRIAYLEWGRHDAGRTVVCVHGLSRNCRDFDLLAAGLAEGFRVVCPDVAGRGDSEWLEDKRDYRFSTYLADAASLIARITAPRPSADADSGEIDWVGTSMGGLIGMLLAAKRASPIRRLVLNDVGAFIPWFALYRLKGYVAEGGVFRSLRDVETYLRDACAPFGSLSDEQWRHLAEHGATRRADGSYQLRYDPAIGNTMRVSTPDPELPLGPNYLSGIDLWSTWRELRCPTLILRGENSDVLSRETALRMQAARPGVEIVEFPAVGHAPALMGANQIETVRNFLLR